MNDFLELCFVIATITTLLFALFFFANNYHLEYRCAQYAEITGSETQWSFGDDCYIKKHGHWKPLNRDAESPSD